MTKFLISLIFIFLSLYSPLANIGVDLHLLDHDHDHHEIEGDKHHHSHNQSNHDSDELDKDINLLHLVHHFGPNSNADHEHIQSARDILSFNFSIPELLPMQPLYAQMRHSLELREIQYFYEKWPSFIAQAYQPPPDQYRVLPLLN